MQRNTSHQLQPLVSCLMVTQKGRFEDIQNATHCFIQQHLEPIELVIVHDSGSAFHERLIKLAKDHPEAKIRIHHEPKGHTLGWLRNRSIHHANSELVCQWDDDDFNHPQRLKTQYELLQKDNSDFCFMTDQLHLYTEQGFLFWDDWQRRQRPFDLIENTLLGKKKLIGKYLDISRGEDTAIIKQISANQYNVSRLSGMGWLYIYVFNGKNTWGFDHHSAISMHYRVKTEKLLDLEELLRSNLKQYDLPFDRIYMPHDKGKIEIVL